MRKINKTIWILIFLFLFPAAKDIEAIDNTKINDFTRIVRRGNSILYNQWEDWEKVYEEELDRFEGQALIDRLRSRWDDIRGQIYNDGGVEKYLEFLEGKLKSQNVATKVRALWEMRYIYFDLADGPLKNLEDTKKEELRGEILDNVMESMQDIKGDFELWYNTKEVLTEMLQDSSHRTYRHYVSIRQDLTLLTERNDPKIKNPREEIWKPALIASLRELAKTDKRWVVSNIDESIRPVRINNNPEMFNLLRRIVDEGNRSNIFKELNLHLTAKEKNQLREILTKTVEEMEAIYQAEKGEVGKLKEGSVGEKDYGDQPLDQAQIGKFGDNVETNITGSIQNNDKKLELIINGKRVVYRYIGPFEKMHSIPIDVYELDSAETLKDEFGRDLPEKILIKGGSSILSLNEYIGYKFYAEMGVPVPRIALVEDNGKLKIAMEFLPEDDYKIGETGKLLPSRFWDNETIQKGIFVSALIHDGDALYQNMMFKTKNVDGPAFYRIDVGGLITRATGRLIRFGNFSIADFNRVTTMTRHLQKIPTNQAYQKVREKFGLLYEYAEEFCDNFDRDTMEDILNQIFDEVDSVLGEGEIDKELQGLWLSLLQAELPYWHRKAAWDHWEAIEALESIEPQGLKDYYIESLISRRNEIEKTFATKNLEPIFLSAIGAKKITDYKITTIEQDGNKIKFGFEVIKGPAKIRRGRLIYNVDTGEVKIAQRVGYLPSFLQGSKVTSVFA